MDDLLKILFETVFEVSGDLAMGSDRIKSGVKTALFSLVGGVFTLVFTVLALLYWDPENKTAGIVLGSVALILLVLTVLGAIKGHKCKWGTRK